MSLQITSLQSKQSTPKRQSGQHIIKKILDAIDEIHTFAPTRTIHVEGVPGRKNIAGNEQADQAVKAAAPPSNTPLSTIMRSALIYYYYYYYSNYTRIVLDPAKGACECLYIIQPNVLRLFFNL
jgi:hypothetical protein